MHITVASGEFLAEEEELSDFVEVGLFVKDGSTVLQGFKLVPVSCRFRVHLSLASRESVSPVAVSDVVCTSAESVDGAHGQSLFVW